MSATRSPDRSFALHAAAMVVCLGVVALLVQALLSERASLADVRMLVEARIPESGTAHAITGVLLAFRAYDTMLEIAVLFVAGIVGLALRDTLSDETVLDRASLAVSSPLLDALAVRLLAAIVVIAAYLLWAGSTMPGGAFQGGAMLAAGGVLLSLLRPDAPHMDHRFRVRSLLSMGFALFVAIAAIGPFGGQPILYLRGVWAGTIILALEAVLTVSIAAVLYSLFVNAPSRPLLSEPDDA